MLHGERRVFRAEVGGHGPIKAAAVTLVVAGIDGDKRRHVVIRQADKLGRNAADGRMLQTGHAAEAGVQIIFRVVMIVDLRGHRAQERHILHALRQLGKLVGHMNARHGGWDAHELAARFGIKGVLLARAAVHPQEDAFFAARPLRRGVGHGLKPRHRHTREQAGRGELEEVTSL